MALEISILQDKCSLCLNCHLQRINLTILGRFCTRARQKVRLCSTFANQILDIIQVEHETAKTHKSLQHVFLKSRKQIFLGCNFKTELLRNGAMVNIQTRPLLRALGQLRALRQLGALGQFEALGQLRALGRPGPGIVRFSNPPPRSQGWNLSVPGITYLPKK